MSNIPDDFDGNTFLKMIVEHGDACSKASQEDLQKLGVKAPICWEAMGMTLALLDCAACCYWGCAKGDHRLEFLLGRFVSNAYAGLHLMRSGYYDQALLMARTLAEAANLLFLFVVDRPQVDRWKTLEERERKREFAPVQVRLKLEALQVPMVADEERYRRLSGYSVHTDPNAMAQVHNPYGRGISFPVYQAAGFLLCLNEIAWPVGAGALFVSRLIKLPDEIRKTLYDVGKTLGEQVGGINVDVKGAPWFRLS